VTLGERVRVLKRAAPTLPHPYSLVLVRIGRCELPTVLQKGMNTGGTSIIVLATSVAFWPMPVMKRGKKDRGDRRPKAPEISEKQARSIRYQMTIAKLPLPSMRDGGELCRLARQELHEPRPTGAIALGIPDHCHGAHN
jgi:hypothetical protein